MQCEKKYCTKFNENRFSGSKNKFVFFAGILLFLLPKCPLCFMAFSSTMVLCSQAGILTEMHTTSSLISLLFSSFFCLLVLLGMFFNYRDGRTIYALLLALAGSCCILFSVTKGGGLQLYYVGLAFIFPAFC